MGPEELLVGCMDTRKKPGQMTLTGLELSEAARALLLVLLLLSSDLLQQFAGKDRKSCSCDRDFGC